MVSQVSHMVHSTALSAVRQLAHRTTWLRSDAGDKAWKGSPSTARVVHPRFFYWVARLWHPSAPQQQTLLAVCASRSQHQ